MHLYTLGIGIALSLVCACAQAGDAAQGAREGDAADAAGLDWIGGHWCGGGEGETLEESWLPPRAGQSLGVSRTMRGGRMSAFEFLRIAVVDGVPAYIAQPGGRAPTVFKRSAGGRHWVRFENPAHDFPQRIEYRRDGDRLVASISGPGEGGKEMTIPFEFRRCPAPAQPSGA